MTDSPRGLPLKQAIPFKSVRKTMAQAMKASVDNAALSQVSREVDLTALQVLRREQLDRVELRFSLNTWIMAAVARALPQHPLLNAELVEREILVYEPVNLGMAVATPNGLIVVVIPGADQLTLAGLAAAVADCVERSRSGKLALSDVEGGTFTVSNLGMYGIDAGFPLPRPPEGAILLIGAARPRAAVVDNQLVIRDIAWFSLSFDHRFIDGAAAAAFLQEVNELLQAPTALLEEN